MMRCKLTTPHLMAYMDGNADAAVNAHIESCNHCQRRVRELEKAQQSLVARLKGNECPSTMHLGEYHLHYANIGETKSIRQHVKGCNSCLTRLNEIAIEVGQRSFGDAQSAKMPLGRPRYNLSNTVIYPQVNAPLLSHGFRGALAETTLNYAIGQGKVSLRLQQSANAITVTGLILGLERTFNRVRLMGAEDSGIVTESPINRLGGFTLNAASRGDYEIALESDDGEAVVLREVNL